MTDEEQSQLTGGEYAIEKLRVCGVRFRDWFHRCWNDLSHAMARAGLLPVWYATAFLYNVGHGPWQSAKFWRDICGSLEDLAKRLTPDSVILQRYWPRVLVDKSLHHDVLDEQVGRAGRERFIQNLAARSQEITDLRGHKVKPAQWVSWNKAHDEWDSEMSTRAMLLGQLALDRGWIPTAEDLFSGAKNIAALSQVEEGKPLPKSKAAAVRSARAKTDALKNNDSQLLCCSGDGRRRPGLHQWRSLDRLGKSSCVCGVLRNGAVGDGPHQRGEHQAAVPQLVAMGLVSRAQGHLASSP